MIRQKLVPNVRINFKNLLKLNNQNIKRINGITKIICTQYFLLKTCIYYKGKREKERERGR